MIKPLLALLSPAGHRARLSVLIFHRVLPRPDPLFPGEIDAAGFDAICRWVKGWFNAGWLRKQGAAAPEARWCTELGAMAQVSLLGYAVGGAFLSLSYFDLPYNLMAAVVLTRIWYQKNAWETEPAYASRWRLIPGLSAAKAR